MSARLNRIDRATVAALMAASGVSASSAELDAVMGALVRMQSAAANLLQSSAFDETCERFFRLLEDDAGQGAGR